MILGRRVSTYFEVFGMVEEVALQRPCFAVIRATRMLAWVCPNPSHLERDVAVFIAWGWWAGVFPAHLQRHRSWRDSTEMLHDSHRLPKSMDIMDIHGMWYPMTVMQHMREYWNPANIFHHSLSAHASTTSLYSPNPEFSQYYIVTPPTWRPLVFTIISTQSHDSIRADPGWSEIFTSKSTANTSSVFRDSSPTVVIGR